MNLSYAAVPPLKIRTFVTIGPSGSQADFNCTGTADDLTFQKAVNYCVSKGFNKLVVKDGTYIFNGIVKITNPNLDIEGSEFGSVIITPSSTASASTGTELADAFFTIYDDSGSDKTLSNIKFKNIVFDYQKIVPGSGRSLDAVRYWPVQGNNTSNLTTTTGITSDQSIATIAAGNDILYGWIENTTANATNVALSTSLPQTGNLTYPTSTAFKHVPSTQLAAGADLNPPATVTTNDTFLGVINMLFELQTMKVTNNTGSSVTFKLQTKPSTVLTNNIGDYTDFTADITIAGNGNYTITPTDIIGSVFPSSVNQLIRIDQSGTTWSGVNLTISNTTFNYVLVPHISVSGTYLGVVPENWVLTNLLFTNNTGSSTSFKLQIRNYVSQNGRDDSYDSEPTNWLDLTSQLTVAGSGTVTIKRSDTIIDCLPDNQPCDIRIVQGSSTWSGVDLTLTSNALITGIYDVYRETNIPGTLAQSHTGFTGDASFDTFPANYYVKSITFTETAGHDWNGFMTDNNINVIDRVFVPASSSVTISHYGNGAKANAVIAGGAITSATVTSGGSNYDAAPIVQIQGDGTGATATATLTGGAVSGITITNGGSGYTVAVITILSIQRYNAVAPLPYSQLMKVKGLQRPAGLVPNTLIWNNASINVSVTLGIRVGITREFINDVFPQDSNRTIYIVGTDNNSYNSASLTTAIQQGAVSQNFTLENIKIRNFNNSGFGAIEIVTGNAFISNKPSYGVHKGMTFRNVYFENSYYPSPQNSSTPMRHLHFTATYVNDIEIDGMYFRNTHGSSIDWHGDSGASTPVVVYRARKNIRVRNLQCIRTKKGIFSGGRLYDWGDETRIGFRDLRFDNPVFEEGSDGWQADFGYKTEGASSPLSITDNAGNSRSNINFMESNNVVINNPRFIRCRTCFDYGYTNPPGNESHHVQINNMYLEDCLEFGDLDGTQAVTYNGGQVIRLRTTGKINNYGAHNPTIFNNVYFEDPSLQTSPDLPDKCLFQVHDGGMQFTNCTVNLTIAQQIDYIFQEQNGNASSSLPIIYKNNIFRGVAPNVRVFGLNSAQYHRIIGNVGITESIIQAVFSGVRTPITATTYLGTGFGNIDVTGNVMDTLPSSVIPSLPYVKTSGDTMSGNLNVVAQVNAGVGYSASFPNTASTSPAYLDAGNNAAILIGASAFTLAASIQLDPSFDFTQNRYIFWCQNQYNFWVRTDGKVSGGCWGGFNPISSTILAAGGTYNVALTYDGVSAAKIYVNGILQNSGTGSNTASGTNHLFVGKSSTAAVNGFMGIIDNVRMWSRALTDTEVTTVHTTNIAPSNCVLELGFDAQSYVDTSATVNTITSTGTSFVSGIASPVPISGKAESVFGDLYVSGNTKTSTFQLTTTPSSGNVLTADSSGNGTWQAPAAGFTNPMTTLGDIIYEDATPTAVRLAGNTTSTKKFLRQTGTGSVSAVPAWDTIVAGDIPTLNQNTTGSAAKWTTARTLAGNSVDGSINVAFANTFIVQGTTDSGLSGAQFLGALSTGLVKNTTTTGVLSIATAGTDYLSPSATQTVSATRINPRIVSTASSTTPTPNGDTTDQYEVTALAAGATFGAPTGTPVDGQKLIIRIKDNGTAQSLAWNAIYVNSGVASLPATTVISKTHTVGLRYDSTAAAWVALAADPVGY